MLFEWKTSLLRRIAVANTPEKVQTFVSCFKKNPARALISNLHTEIEHLEIGGLSFPISVNSGNFCGNCYVCDPITGYVDYALDETRNFSESPFVRGAVRALILASAPLVRATGLNNIVIVNNWLFSTNPIPHLTPQLARELKDRLIARYPDKIIAIRSLNSIADPHSIAALCAEGYRTLPSRQIYVFSHGGLTEAPSSNMKYDQKLLKTNAYERVSNDQFHERDYDRCAELYSMLYLDKYTHLNPQYTALFMREMHQNNLIKLNGMRDQSGDLIVVTGLFVNGNTLTQPIVGYDTSLPIREGLYRIAMAIGQDYAIKNQLFFNMSAGAAHFKRLRNALPVVEVMAIYDHHLPRRQQYALRTVEILLKRVGVPLLQRFGL